MFRRRDFSLVGGLLRLTTPTGSPSDELLDSDPQSVTDSGDKALNSLADAAAAAAAAATVLDVVEQLDPVDSLDSSVVIGLLDESGRTSIMDGSANRKR